MCVCVVRSVFSDVETEKSRETGLVEKPKSIAWHPLWEIGSTKKVTKFSNLTHFGWGGHKY